MIVYVARQRHWMSTVSPYRYLTADKTLLVSLLFVNKNRIFAIKSEKLITHGSPKRQLESNMQIVWSAVAASLLPNVGGIVGGLITRKNIPIWYKVRCFTIVQYYYNVTLRFLKRYGFILTHLHSQVAWL